MRNKLTNELAVCGVKAVAAAGEIHLEAINRLFIRQDRLPLFSKICKNLAERKRPYKMCDDEELERICKSAHHQGVVAMIEEPRIEALSREDLAQWAGEGLMGLVLHSVGNDHNLGAIARSAAFFGARFLVLSDTDEQARLTTSAYRVAEGGLEYITVRSVHNTSAFLKDASKKIITIGTDPRARLRIADMDAIVKEQAKRLAPEGNRENIGFAVVIGNEETGLPPEVKNSCSALARISGCGNIESLNAAQAATLFLHALFDSF
jgi:TrmH RNA methyltransferase